MATEKIPTPGGEEGAPEAPPGKPADKPGLRALPRPSGAGGAPRYSAGQRLQKTAKGPSKVGRAIKFTLIFIVVVGLPAVVTGGFIFQDSKGNFIWKALARKLGRTFGWTEPEKKPGKVVKMKSELDQKYDTAVGARVRAEFYLKATVRHAEDQLDQLTPEKAEEIVKELTRWLDLVTAGIDDIKAVVDETNKPEGTTQSDADNLQANRDLQAQTTFRKEILQILHRWRGILDEKLGKRPEPPPPAPTDKRTDLAKVEEKRPEEPKPAPKVEVPKRPDPWAPFKPGTWVRYKSTTQAGGAQEVALTDTIIEEVSETFVDLKIETAVGGNVSAQGHRIPRALVDEKVVGEEKLTVGDQEIACVVIEGTGARTWLPKEGLALGLTALRAETGETVARALSLAEEELKVGERPVRCLKVEMENRTGEAVVKYTQWISETVPGSVVRSVTEGPPPTTREVITLGEDPSSRPPLAAPEPKKEAPPEARDEEALTETDRLVIDGSLIFQEQAAALREPPSEPERLRALLRRNDEANSLFVKARETYVIAKERALDPSKIAERLERIDKILALLRNYRERIELKLR